jgi:hypothetical protein
MNNNISKMDDNIIVSTSIIFMFYGMVMLISFFIAVFSVIGFIGLKVNKFLEKIRR